MAKPMEQTSLFRGVYEFDDPSGVLLAAKIPNSGSANLYDGTAIVVRPNQCAIFVYKGKIADVLRPGTHTIGMTDGTPNVPILTALSNWKYGFRNPLRCELWFFSGQQFNGRRWGTSQPVVYPFQEGAINIRAFGNYQVRITDPSKLLMKLIGTRAEFSVNDVEDFIQGHILEVLPQAMEGVKSLTDLSKSQRNVASRLQQFLDGRLSQFGLSVAGVQVLSLLPPKEVIQALDVKAAMDVIGDKREFLFYKAANSLDASHTSGGKDPMQLMMGMMLGKSLSEVNYHEKEAARVAPPQLVRTEATAPAICPHCQTPTQANFRFCPSCGKENSK